MATIAIENPYKLDGLINGDTRYMIRYEGKNLSHPNDNYSWTVLNVLGNYGRLIIERDIVDISNAFNTPSVKSFWSGNEKGEEWLNIDKIKEPQWVMAYMLDCIDGKFDK
jgi:hypothetical protein